MNKNLLYALDTTALLDGDTYRAYFEQMDEDRKNKILSLKPEKSKRLSLGAGIVLKEGLRELGAGNATIITNDNGKPAPLNLDFFFNLSHGGDVAVAAFSDHEIGVDVEKVRTFKDNLVKRVFLPREKELLENTISLGFDRNLVATYLWTVKEAVMKYYGIGLSMDPLNICLDTDGKNSYINKACQKTKIHVFYKEIENKGIHIKNYEFDDYQISVCSEYEDFGAEIKWITL